MRHEATCIAAPRCRLGESPVWAPQERALYWLDIGSPSTLFRWDAALGETRHWRLPELAGGLVLSSDERLIVVSQSGIGAFDIAAGSLELLAAPPREMGSLRFNDCGCDSRGRLWTGTMSNEFNGSPAVPGTLWRYGGEQQWQRMAEGFGCPNTFAWSPDDATLYVADSNVGRIYAHDFDAASGVLSRRRVFANSSSDGSASLGIPDGSAVDRDGCLWNARWAGGCVARFSPAGAILQVVTIPASLVTSCAFGGDDMSELYVTSATSGLTAEQLTREPSAGAVFRVKTNTSGMAPHRFRQSARVRGLAR